LAKGYGYFSLRNGGGRECFSRERPGIAALEAPFDARSSGDKSPTNPRENHRKDESQSFVHICKERRQTTETETETQKLSNPPPPPPPLDVKPTQDGEEVAGIQVQAHDFKAEVQAHQEGQGAPQEEAPRGEPQEAPRHQAPGRGLYKSNAVTHSSKAPGENQMIEPQTAAPRARRACRTTAYL
jgi:hypothetical protein